MMGLAVGGLAVLCLANLVLSVAIVGRLRRTTDRLMPNQRLIGASVRPFDVIDHAGRRRTNRDLSEGTQRLVFLSTDCPSCATLAASVAAAPEATTDTALTLVVVTDAVDPPMAADLAPRFPTIVDPPHGPVATCVGEVQAFPAVLTLEAGVVVGASHHLTPLK